MNALVSGCSTLPFRAVMADDGWDEEALGDVLGAEEARHVVVHAHRPSAKTCNVRCRVLQPSMLQLFWRIQLGDLD